jgi:hypothetical protein
MRLLSEAIAATGLVALCVVCASAQAQDQGRGQPFAWRGQHLSLASNDDVDPLIQLINDHLAPMGVNVLVVEVNYNFQFQSHPEISQGTLDKAGARRVAAACRARGIRVIPLLNCLGHQSWARQTFTLLTQHPDFDETPQIPLNNPDIYCRSWCPQNPDVNALVFDLMDELLDAFQADALHVGMDEVFLIGSDQCPRCRGKNPAELFAKAVNDIHKHLVEDRGVEMLMWGDRLLDGQQTGYGEWEASTNGTAPAVDMIPKDIILCDWHYTKRAEYPSIPYFEQKGFRVLAAPWNNPSAAEAFIRYSMGTATDKFLGVLFTGWSAGGGGTGILAGLRGETGRGGRGGGEAAVLKHCIGACMGGPFAESEQHQALAAAGVNQQVLTDLKSDDSKTAVRTAVRETIRAIYTGRADVAKPLLMDGAVTVADGLEGGPDAQVFDRDQLLAALQDRGTVPEGGLKIDVPDDSLEVLGDVALVRATLSGVPELPHPVEVTAAAGRVDDRWYVAVLVAMIGVQPGSELSPEAAEVVSALTGADAGTQALVEHLSDGPCLLLVGGRGSARVMAGRDAIQQGTSRRGFPVVGAAQGDLQVTMGQQAAIVRYDRRSQRGGNGFVTHNLLVLARQAGKWQVVALVAGTGRDNG